MRFGFTAGAVVCALTSVGAFVVACSSDEGTLASPVSPDGGPPVDAALTDTSLPDTSTPGEAEIEPPWSSAEIDAMKTLTPLPAVPPDPTNAFADDAAAAVLGQRLFFDKAFSGAIIAAGPSGGGGLGVVGATGAVACVDCHSSKATTDDRSKPGNVSLGTNFGTRNALSIVNSSFYAWTNWGGRFDSQWSLPPAVVENPATMNGTRLQIAHVLWNKYKADYDAIFPVPLDTRLDPADPNAADFPLTGKPKAAGGVDGPWEGMAPDDRTIVTRIFANFGKAIAAYMRLEVSRNATFDKYVASNLDKKGMTLAEKRGLRVFLGKGNCIKCHSGPNFADSQFSNIGVEQTGPGVPAIDLGRYQDVPALLASPLNTNGAFSDKLNTGKLTALAQADTQLGQFRTKSLRGLSNAAPYMHSGQLATLESVVDFYSTGKSASGDAGATDVRIKPLNLSAIEKSDLVAFLKTLDGEPIPATLLMDTHRP